MKIGKLSRHLHHALLVLGGTITVAVTFILLTGNRPPPEITSAPPTALIQCDETRVVSAVWNPSRGLIACSGASQPGIIQIWETEHWQRVAQLQRHTGLVYTLAWSPDGSRLASQAEDHTIYIWDATTFQPIVSYQADSINTSTEVAEFHWNADGSKLMKIPHSVGTIQIWDLAADSPPVSLWMGNAVTWDSEMRIVAVSISDTGCIQIWDAVNAFPLRRYHPGPNPVLSLAWSPDQKVIASASEDGVSLWDPDNGEVLLTLSQELGFGKVLWSPDGTQVAGISQHTLSIWNATTGQVISNFPVDSLMMLHNNYAAWSPDGQMLVLSGGPENVDEWYGKVWVWDAGTDKLFAQITDKDPGPCVRWGPDGHHLLAVEPSGQLNIWSLPDIAQASGPRAPAA